MISAKGKVGSALLLVGVLVLAALPMLGGSAVVGSVAGSLNATLGGQALVANATVFSGDSLQVKDGAAVIALGNGSRLVFGRETVASFLRESGEVTVLLGQGNVSLYQAGAGVGLRVKVGTVSVVPATGFKTLGEVAMVNGAVVVTAKEGRLRVEGNGPAVEVAKGKTLTLDGKVARAPQGGAAGAGSGAAGMSAGAALQVGSIAAGGASAVLSGVAISRAGDARDAAAAASDTGTKAVTAANTATAAATAASDTASEILTTLCTSELSPIFPSCQQ
ncbi:MAG: hypothetical protein LAN62_00745 [Acidobacteriia bacterium]|nr:hypothetical protein [Terriglobia bacterium]